MDSRNRRNLAVNVVGESLWGFQAALIASSTVLVTLLRAFGASKAMIGSIGAIEVVAFMVPQTLGLYIFQSRARRRRQLVQYQVFLLLPVLLGMGGVVFGVGRLGPGVAGVALLVLHSIFCFLAVDDPAEGETELPPAASWRDILAHFRVSLENPNFRTFLLGRVFASFGFCMIPLVTDFYASHEGGGLGAGAVVRCGAAFASSGD